MSEEATNQKTEMELLSDHELEAIAGGGHSQCEGDDGSSSGGTSKPKPTRPAGQNSQILSNIILDATEAG